VLFKQLLQPGDCLFVFPFAFELLVLFVKLVDSGHGKPRQWISRYHSRPPVPCPLAPVPWPMLRLAFLGTDHPHGAHWRQQLANFANDAQVVALVPSFGGGTASLEERYADLPRFDSVDALLKGAEFDAGVVCLSNRDGPRAIAALAAAGKHVLAEKPVAATAADAQQIVDAVEKSGVAFQ